MKIGIIGHKRIPSNEGGIEKGVEEHASRMTAKGHQVDVYNRGGHNIYGEEYDTKRRKEYKGIRIITVPTLQNNILNALIYSFLATIRALFGHYDVISYRASGSCVMINIAKLFGIRCVASLHGIDSQRDKWNKFASKYLEFGERTAAKKADILIVLSRNMQEYIYQKYGRETVLVPNGISKSKKYEIEIIKEKYSLQKDGYILFLSRIVPEKGVHYLIQAFKEIETDKKLVIAGGYAETSEYYKSLREMSMDDSRIIFTGFVHGNELSEFYSNAYVYVLPSNLEGMANALLEALEYGNCCLVSNIPENTEVIEDKAISFNKGDIKDLKDKLEYLINNPQIVQDYKKDASEFILEKYNWDKIVDQLLELYVG